ncbi:hypothetical protein SESBI_25858 [Sesbania bispinosa]|nr:hypothetical protein SESBI_25858 [Sesbania bispinosa]
MAHFQKGLMERLCASSKLIRMGCLERSSLERRRKIKTPNEAFTHDLKLQNHPGIFLTQK